MHKYFFNIVLLLLFPIGSCDDSYQMYGYPEWVEVPQEGGEEVVMGTTKKNMLIEIQDEDKGIGEYRGDSMYVEYKWLTAIHVRNTNSIKLVAKPNDTGKGRGLCVELYFDGKKGSLAETGQIDKQGTINVYQAP